MFVYISFEDPLNRPNHVSVNFFYLEVDRRNEENKTWKTNNHLSFPIQFISLVGLYFRNSKGKGKCY